MGNKIIVTALAVLAFAFGSVLRSNAGTEVIEQYRGPAPTYNYAPPPPPRPIFYVPPPAVGVVVAPGFGYYRPGFGYYRARGFYGRRGHWHHHHWD